MTVEQSKELVSEYDKPFILLLILTIGVLAIGSYAVVTNVYQNAKDFIGVLTPLLGMGWAFYFKSKQ